jgi:uncharacterized protein
MTVTVEHDVPARMGDGVTLRANVYRPSAGGPWPVLLTRTPYDKNELREQIWTGVDPVHAARRGFVVVIQDTRGRFASDGEWAPLRHERQDGVETVAWAASLAGSNGRVGMYGGSYCGHTQLAPATAQPPALGAIAPAMTWADPMDGLFARGGAMELGTVLPWSLAQGFDHVRRTETHSALLPDRLAALITGWDRLDEEGYWDLPIAGNSVLDRHAIPELGSIAASMDATVARDARISDAYDRVVVPALFTTGWYDNLLQGTLDNYTGIAAAGGNPRLIVGPWTHLRLRDPIGQRPFGLRANRDDGPVYPRGSWRDFQLAWFERWLHPDRDVDLPEAPVRIFVMGRNQWRDEHSWPVERAVSERWFLHPGGRLDREPPGGGQPASTFRYDPADPVPTIGGNTVMWPAYVAGPLDQAAVEQRDDVLVFTSGPLNDDLEVTGRVHVVLQAESSAPSTDWVARLCDVLPDGRSFNVCDGIVRAVSGADSLSRREIDLWSTSIVFLAGHRLRVTITSSSFPRWDRNLNTGRQRESRLVPARQRVWHGAEHLSWVELPVIAS